MLEKGRDPTYRRKVRWFETIGALPFMEPGSVVDVWRDHLVSNLPQEMSEFGSYFERTWI